MGEVKYNAWVSVEVWSRTDIFVGWPSGVYIERQPGAPVDTAELARLGREFGIERRIRPAERKTRWISRKPADDPEFWESGEEKYFSLFVERVDGEECSLDELRELDRVICGE